MTKTMPTTITYPSIELRKKDKGFRDEDVISSRDYVVTLELAQTSDGNIVGRITINDGHPIYESCIVGDTLDIHLPITIVERRRDDDEVRREVNAGRLRVRE